MSLVTQISDVVTAIGTQFKTVANQIGSLASLATTNKTNLVAAINEVAGEVAGGGGASINDTAPSTTTVYSSSKTEAVATAAADALIDDAAAATTSVYSSQKTSDSITAAIGSLVGGAPGALDTLKELADAIGDDANYAAGITTALSNKLDVGTAQALTGTQKTQGQNNLDVYAKADMGDPTTDFVAVFNAALA